MPSDTPNGPHDPLKPTPDGPGTDATRPNWASRPIPPAAPLPPSAGVGELPGAPTGRRYGSALGAIVAWVAILAVSLTWILLSNIEPPDDATDAPSRIGAMEEMQGRMVLGFDSVFRSLGSPNPTILDQAASLKDGTPIQRIAFAILVNAVSGPGAANDILDQIETGVDGKPLEPDDESLLRATKEHVQATEAGSTPAPLEAAYAERLGWFGKVLDGTATGSSRIVLVLVGAGLWYVGIGVVGFALLIICIVFAISGRLQSTLQPASPLGSILAETFAVWIALFFGMQAVAMGLTVAFPDLPALRMTLAPLSFAVSLLALGWPRIRGVPWSETRAAIGLTGGKGPQEVLWGGLGYALALPCMGVGVVIALGLTALFGDGQQASHPAVEEMAKSSPAELLWLFALACICAPVVEEIFFRGVLYRHLRDATAGRAPTGLLTFLSIVVSALVSSAIFALIHPQGVLFAPALAGLAFGYCLVREWRGSLIACMVAHAITNFVTLLLNLGLQGG